LTMLKYWYLLWNVYVRNRSNHEEDGLSRPKSITMILIF
jgi:hypothetical protein